MRKFNLLLFMFWIAVLTGTEFRATAQRQETSPTDTSQTRSRIRSLADLAKKYVDKPGEDSADMKQSMYYARQALSLSQNYGYVEGEAIATTIMAQVLREMGDRQRGTEYATKAISYFKVAGFHFE